MTFTEWLKQYELFAYLIGVLFLIIIIVFSIKFYMMRIERKAKVKRDIVATDIFDTLKELEIKREIKLKPSKKIKKEKPKPEPVIDTPAKPFSPVKVHKITSYAYWRAWFIDKYFPSMALMINMELLNGFHRSFIIKGGDDGFVFRGKQYLFDDDHKYYNMDAKLYAYDYHEGLVLPIKRKIPLQSIKKTIESADLDIEYAINPSTLQRFMTAKIAEGVMKGTMIDEFLRKLQMFLLVTMVAVLVHLVLFLYASGILKNIQVPFM